MDFRVCVCLHLHQGSQIQPAGPHYAASARGWRQLPVSLTHCSARRWVKAAKCNMQWSEGDYALCLLICFSGKVGCEGGGGEVHFVLWSQACVNDYILYSHGSTGLCNFFNLNSGINILFTCVLKPFLCVCVVTLFYICVQSFPFYPSVTLLIISIKCSWFIISAAEWSSWLPLYGNLCCKLVAQPACMTQDVMAGYLSQKVSWQPHLPVHPQSILKPKVGAKS